MRRPSIFGLFALLASVAPLFAANEVYVPIASNKDVNGTIYRTSIWATNTGQIGLNFTLSFIETGIDGTLSPRQPSTITVPAGRSVQISTGVPAGKSGMLEIAGAAEIMIDARLEAIGADGSIRSSAQVPVLSPERVVPAGTRAHLQGLERSAAGPITDFGVVNLSRQPARCSIEAYQANGTRIGSTAVITLLPLSHREFSEVLVSLGQIQISDARFMVSCDRSFSTFAIVFDVGGPQTAVVAPGGGLDGSLEPGTVLGGVTLSMPGKFFTATHSDSHRVIEIPLQPNQPYKRATVEFDMFLNKFQGFFTSVTSMRRAHPDRHQRVLYFGIQIRGSNGNTILDLGDDHFVKTKAPWKEKRNYHLKFDYDLETRQVSLRVFEGNNQIYQIAGLTPHNDLSNDGHKVNVDFGQVGIADHAYFPPWGWAFSNLKVSVEPGAAN